MANYGICSKKEAFNCFVLKKIARILFLKFLSIIMKIRHYIFSALKFNKK